MLIPQAIVTQQVADTDGWVDDTATSWVFASSTTFTVAGVDVTAKFSKGTRIKLTQTTVKYFVVVNSSFSTNTTVTITGGSDYTLANAAITNNFYSYAANPPGYPDWFNYEPTYGGFSSPPSPGAGYVKFRVDGETVTFGHQPGNGTSNATTFTISVPVPIVGIVWQIGYVLNNSVAQTNPGMVQFSDADTLVAQRDLASAAWTASGTKNILGVWHYEY